MGDNFWETKTLSEMDHGEWEALCDGCGICCLNKLEDEDTGEVFYTDVACRLLDLATCRCKDYPNRTRRVPDCLVLSPEKALSFHWLPETCAYRRVAEGYSLPPWHPLVAAENGEAGRGGVSVRGKAVSEEEVTEEELEERLVTDLSFFYTDS